MIRVRPTAYKLLWSFVLVLGVLMIVPAAMMNAPGTTVLSGKEMLYFAAGVGVLVVTYALRRLIWPLSAPPKE